jgi:hypothetical protein
MKWLPFNPGKPKVQLAVSLVIVLLLLAFASRCHADSYAQFGAGSTVVRGESAIIDLALVYPDAGPRDAAIEVGATFIGTSEHEGAGQRNNFALRAAVVDGFKRFDVGLGVAYLQNTDIYNGSHVNFTLLLGYRFKRLPLTMRLQHFSNGGTQSPNKGRDMLFLAWRF